MQGTRSLAAEICSGKAQPAMVGIPTYGDFLVEFLDYQDIHDHEMRITAPTGICHLHDFYSILDDDDISPRYQSLRSMRAIPKPSPSLPTDAILTLASAVIIARID